MAGSSLLTLIDDIATLLDDVAAMTKVAAKKTAGVLGDDLALNAQQVSGVSADRELPVVWAVAKGSLVNKVILVPSALLISALAPWAITPILMLGGAYLCYEGFEKLAHKYLHKHDAGQDGHLERLQAVTNPAIDMVAYERDKIRAAIRTDLVLSAEIIAITLGVIATLPFPQQVAVLSVVAFGITVGVYGLVAGIVKLDDLGLFLAQKPSAIAQRVGLALVSSAPYLMKGLSVVGTAAMFMVGGGILTHGLPVVHEAINAITHMAGTLPGIGGVVAATTPTLLDAVFGMLAGAALLGCVTLATWAFKRKEAEDQ